MQVKFSEKYPGLNSFLSEPKWKQVRGVILFVIITVAIHLAWRFWAYYLIYFPINGWMNDITNTMSDMVFKQSSWFVIHVLGVHLTFEPGNIMWLDNKSGIQITGGCSGIKQILQFALLLIIYPGNWKRKIWFIPLGILVVHITNLLRVIGMVLTGLMKPESIKFMHDNFLRGLFYIVIFCLWWIWEQKISGNLVRPDGNPK
jgi:exosortase/archaeosortase family protein